MWKHAVVAVLALGLWACATGEEAGAESAEEVGRVLRQVYHATGSLRQARTQHTSSRLADGRVLYAGGCSESGQALMSVELYDPVTELTSFGAPLHTARCGHTAVVLNDGSVLVLGGSNGTAVTASVERYEPSTNTWSQLPPMPSGSSGHTASLLADGRVLVAGGTSPTSAFLFNPTTRTWTATGSLAMGRTKSTAMRLPDGRVLMLGGGVGGPGSAVELYEPSTGTWSSRTSLPASVEASSAVLLPNGRVVLNMGSAAAEYDVSADTWTPLPAFNRPHAGGTLALVRGQLVVLGGTQPAIERFNPVSKQWSIVDEFVKGRVEATVDVLADHTVLLAGGRLEGSSFLLTTLTVFFLEGPCTGLTCAAAGAQCGQVPDGCGGTLECGTCGSGYTCGSRVCLPGPQVSDFALVPTVSSRVIARDGVASYPFTTVGTGTLQLSVSGLPPGASALLPATLVAGGSASLEVHTLNETSTAGRYPLTITGTDGARTHSATVTLIVTASPGPDPIVNGGFETGTLSGWNTTGTASVGPHASIGSFGAVLGAPGSALAQDSQLSQTFTVPAAGALLRYRLFVHAMDVPADYASVLLQDHTTGVTTVLLERAYNEPSATWVGRNHDLMPYAGHRVTLIFLNHEAGGGGATYTFIDGVSLLVPSGFQVSLSQPSRMVQVGSGATYTVNTSGQGTLTLSASGLPAGSSATFNPATVTAGQSSTLTVNTRGTFTGSLRFEVTGTDASQQTATAPAWLNITPPWVLLENPHQTVRAGDRATFSVKTSGSGSLSFSIPNLPQGINVLGGPGGHLGAITAGNSFTFQLTTTACSTPDSGPPYCSPTGTFPFTLLGEEMTSPRVPHPVSGELVVIPALRVSVSPSSSSVRVGEAMSFTVRTSGLGPVALATSALPTGVTAAFNPATVTAGQSSTLTLSISDSTASRGTWVRFTVTATELDSRMTHSVPAEVYVAAPRLALRSGSSSSQTAQAGNSATYVLEANPEAPLTLSVSGLPAGVTATFSQATVTAGQSSTLTLSTTRASLTGTFPFTIVGSEPGQVIRPISAQLTVTAAPPLELSWSSSATQAGYTKSYTVYTGGPGSRILSVSGLPAGVTATFSRNPMTSDQWSSLTLYTSPSTPVGNHTITVTALNPDTQGSHSATGPLDIAPAPQLTLSPATQSSWAGGVVTYTVSTTSDYYLDLSVSGLPAGITATFNPTRAARGYPATLTLSTSGSIPLGTHPFTIVGKVDRAQQPFSVSGQLIINSSSPPTSGTFGYSAANTNSAQQNTTNYSVVLTAGQTLRVGTCTVPGASGSGDTYLRLYGVSGTQVAANDDSCGTLSYLSYQATQSGTYQIRAGCFSSNSCSGTVAFTVQ
jgi:hypothetical protein